jgi:putative Mn2+ efflux pump MntP
MVYNSFKGDGVQVLDHRSPLGLLLFALGVSVDSFSVGVSLGMFQSDLVLSVLAFGFCGGAMAMLGLLLGRKVSRNLGDYGEAVGGAILLAFGFMFMF